MKRTKKHIEHINKYKVYVETQKNAKNLLFQVDLDNEKFSKQEITEKIANYKEGIDNIVLKIKEKNKIESLKDKTKLKERLNRKNLFGDCKVQNIVDVKKHIKNAKINLTNTMNNVEFQLYNELYVYEQLKLEVLKPVLKYLELAWEQESEEIDSITKKVNQFVKSLDDENKKLLGMERNNE